MRERTIHKFELKLKVGPQSILMPPGAGILTAQMQEGKLMVWAVVFVPSVSVLVQFHLLWTGAEFSASRRSNYIATVQHGGLVWHVFVEPSNFSVKPHEPL